MYSLIISCGDQDIVAVSPSKERLERHAVDWLKEQVKLHKKYDENDFGSLEVEQMLIECLEVGDSESAMELYAEISDAKGEIVYMRISPKTEVMWDA